MVPVYGDFARAVNELPAIGRENGLVRAVLGVPQGSRQGGGLEAGVPICLTRCSCLVCRSPPSGLP